MALRKQMIPIPLIGGVETREDPLQVQPGKLLLSENVRYESPGRITKRPYYPALLPNALSGSSLFSAGRGLGALGKELVVSTGYDVFARSKTGYTKVGPAPGGIITTRPVMRNDLEQVGADCGHSTNYACYAWREGVNIYEQMIDRETGEPVPIPTGYGRNVATSAAAACAPKVLLLGNEFYVLYAEVIAGVTSLKAARCPTYSPEMMYAGVTLITGLSSLVWDATVIGSKIYILYASGAATTSIRSWDGATVSDATQVQARQLNAGTIFPSGSNVGVVYYSDGGAHDGTGRGYYQGFNATTMATVEAEYWIISLANNAGQYVSGITATRVLPASTGTNTIWTAYTIEDANGVGSNLPRVQVISYLVGLGTSDGAGSWGWRVAGKIWSPDSLGSQPHIYFPVHYPSATQPTYAIATFAGWIGIQIAAKYARTSAPSTAPALPLPETNQTATNVAEFAFLQMSQRAVVNDGSIIGQRGVMAGKYDMTVAQQMVEFAGGLYLTGGLLTYFDGQQMLESGFTVYPDSASNYMGVAPQGINSGSIPAGQRQYVAVYEYTDGKGNVTRSAPSLPRTVTTAANDSVLISVRSPSVSLRVNVAVAIYRTVANGTVFYRVTGMPNTFFTYRQNTFDTFTDSMSDITLVGNEELYTGGGAGEADNIAPPAPKVLGVYKNRLILVSSEEPTTWWPSKQYVPGFPAEFSDLFVQYMDKRIGEITAICQLDDKCIFFGPTSIWAVTGDGPADDGSNNDFSKPYMISAEVGATDWRSVVLTPDGIMFQSARGFYLLQRDLTLNRRIADPAFGFSADVVTSAVSDRSTNEVRFSLASGKVLVWNHSVGQWAIWTGLDAVAGCVYQGKHALLKSIGLVLYEDPTVYADYGSVLAPMKIRTPWFSFGGIQGFQRVYRVLILGEWKSAHSLLVKVRHDFQSATNTQSLTVAAPTTVTPYQLRIHLSRQKCESLQIELEESQSAPYGAGLSLSNIVLEIGVKKGPYKLPAAQTTG